MSRFFGGIFDYENKSTRLSEVIRELENPNIWNNPDQAQALGKERARLEKIVNVLDRLHNSLADTKELLELAVAENDEVSFNALVGHCSIQSPQLMHFVAMNTKFALDVYRCL